MKRIKSLQPFLNTLPYSSELFGVYQPLLGWKSRRMEKRWRRPHRDHEKRLADDLIRYFDGITKLEFNQDCFASLIVAEPGRFAGPKLNDQHFLILEAIARSLPEDRNLNGDEWHRLLKPDVLKRLLHDTIFP